MQQITDSVIKKLELGQDKKISNYVASCVSICSGMCQDDPRMFMDFQDFEKSGVHFNSKLYRAYKKDGNQLNYVVWPPLYQMTLLTKGVAQGKD